MVSFVLGEIASRILQVSLFFLNMAHAIYGVPILGPNLYEWFIVIHAELLVWYSNAGALQDAWDTFEGGLSGGFSLPWELSTFIPWVDTVLQFFQDPWPQIALAIMNNIPGFFDFFDDPWYFIRSIVNQAIEEAGLISGSIDDMVRNFMINYFPDFELLSWSPTDWIITIIGRIDDEASRFIQNPYAWIYNILAEELREIRTFIDNPAEYIMPLLIDFINKKIEDYQKELQDIATKILERIF